MNAKKCIFFDRDGVVNLSPGGGYVLSWDQFSFTPGIIELLKAVREKDWLTVLVTSQKGVGKELMSESDLDNIHTRMQQRLAEEQAAFDAIYAYTQTPDCPHRPKPDPEMIFTAARDLDIDLEQALLVGDSDRDIEMGRAAGLKACIRFLSDKEPGVEADYTAADVAALQEILENLS